MTSSRQTLRLDIVSPQSSRDTGGFVLLQQEAWNPYVGQLTKQSMFAWLNKFLFGTNPPSTNCPPGTPGSFSKEIYAYPSSPGLSFVVGCSHGRVGAGIAQTSDYTELVQINLQPSLPLEYPPQRIASHLWEGDVYDEQGNTTSPPAVSIVGDTVHISAPVYGSLRITYSVFRVVYTVAITARLEHVEKKYQSYFFACWSGGNTYLEIEAPIGAEKEQNTIPCNNRWGDSPGGFGGLTTGGTTSGDGDDQDSPYPPVTGEDEYVDIDYCTQEIR